MSDFYKQQRHVIGSMGIIKRIYHKNKEIITIDYSNSKEDEMIKLVVEKREIVESKMNNLTVVIFNHQIFFTPKFMRHVERTLKEMANRIDKNAITGLTETQLWILKGVNLWYKKKIRYFKSLAEAWDFLVE